MPMSKALVRGVVKSKTCLTYTGWQGLIPSSPLPSQTDQHPAASQRVARVAIKGYRAASEVPFIVDLVAKLRDARVLAFDEFKTWSERNSINFPHMFNSQKPLAQDYINCFPLKKNALLAKRNTIWRIVFFWLRLERDPRDLISQLQVEISVSSLPHSQQNRLAGIIHLLHSASSLDPKIFIERTICSTHATVTPRYTTTPHIPISQAYGPKTY